MNSNLVPLACAISGMAVVLHGCGGGAAQTTATTTTATTTTATTTTITTTTTPHWTPFLGMQCDGVYGASFNCGSSKSSNLDDCKKQCESLVNCEGVSQGKWGGECKMLSNLFLFSDKAERSGCKNGTNTNTYVHRFKQPQYPTSNKWAVDASEVVKKANELFASNDTGVLVHSHTNMYDGDNPWTAYASAQDLMSFCVLNKAAFAYGNIKMFRDGFGPTIMGTPDSQSMVKCFFPCDGYTAARVNHGCGKPIFWGVPDQGQKKCGGVENDNWCKDGVVTGLPFDNKYDKDKKGLGFPCAFKPADLAVGLQRQADYKAGKAGPGGNLQHICTYQHPPYESHNEAIVDGYLWDHNLPNNVWAFGLTSACAPNATCKSKTIGHRDSFAKTYGRTLPIIYIDLKKGTDPFSEFKVGEVPVSENLAEKPDFFADATEYV